jgi:hypothetical protein
MAASLGYDLVWYSQVVDLQFFLLNRGENTKYLMKAEAARPAKPSQCRL